MDFVVKRSNWLRGGRERMNEPSVLCSVYTGRMCCLGFACFQLGVEKRELEDESMPTKFLSTRTHLFALSSEAVAINDSPDFTDEERERLLSELFAQHGHTITFID